MQFYINKMIIYLVHCHIIKYIIIQVYILRLPGCNAFHSILEGMLQFILKLTKVIMFIFTDFTIYLLYPYHRNSGFHLENMHWQENLADCRFYLITASKLNFLNS